MDEFIENRKIAGIIKKENKGTCQQSSVWGTWNFDGKPGKAKNSHSQAVGVDAERVLVDTNIGEQETFKNQSGGNKGTCQHISKLKDYNFDGSAETTRNPNSLAFAVGTAPSGLPRGGPGDMDTSHVAVVGVDEKDIRREETAENEIEEKGREVGQPRGLSAKNQETEAADEPESRHTCLNSGSARSRESEKDEDSEEDEDDEAFEVEHKTVLGLQPQ